MAKFGPTEESQESLRDDTAMQSLQENPAGWWTLCTTYSPTQTNFVHKACVGCIKVNESRIRETCITLLQKSRCRQGATNFLARSCCKNLHILCVLLQHLSQEFKHLLVRKFSNDWKQYASGKSILCNFSRISDVWACSWHPCQEVVLWRMCREHMLQAALGVKTELFPEWGKWVRGGDFIMARHAEPLPKIHSSWLHTHLTSYTLLHSHILSLSTSDQSFV